MDSRRFSRNFQVFSSSDFWIFWLSVWDHTAWAPEGLVSYPTRWSLLFVFGFLYFSIQATEKYSTVKGCHLQVGASRLFSLGCPAYVTKAPQNVGDKIPLFPTLLPWGLLWSQAQIIPRPSIQSQILKFWGLSYFQYPFKFRQSLVEISMIKSPDVLNFELF